MTARQIGESHLHRTKRGSSSSRIAVSGISTRKILREETEAVYLPEQMSRSRGREWYCFLIVGEARNCRLPINRDKGL